MCAFPFSEAISASEPITGDNRQEGRGTAERRVSLRFIVERVDRIRGYGPGVRMRGNLGVLVENLVPLDIDDHRGMEELSLACCGLKERQQLSVRQVACGNRSRVLNQNENYEAERPSPPRAASLSPYPSFHPRSFLGFVPRMEHRQQYQRRRKHPRVPDASPPNASGVGEQIDAQVSIIYKAHPSPSVFQQ
jgi:hypothetical protein